jgi:hypothetical protein
MPYFWQMKVAWVPLPAPGAPNRISLMCLLELRQKQSFAASSWMLAAVHLPLEE